MKITSFSSILFVACIAFSSCEVEPEDTKIPEISLSLGANDQPVSSGETVRRTISFVAESDEKVSFVLSVDGSAVYELLNSNSFKFDFDTKTLTDGPHEFKLVAADPKGNSSEVTFPVTVTNILLDLAYNPGAFKSSAGVRYFIILSNADGNVIAHKELIDGAVLFEYPDNYDEEDVTITVLDEIKPADALPLYFINTFSKVKHGKYRFNTTPTVTPSGIHTVAFANSDGYDFIFTDDNVASARYGNGSEVKLSLASEGVSVYMYRNAAIGKNYKLLENVKSGESTVFDNEKIAAMPLHTTHSLATTTGDISSIVYGIKQSNKLVNVSHNISPDKADILYPAELYPNYFKGFKTVIQRTVPEGNYKAYISTSGPNDNRGFLSSIDSYDASLISVPSGSHPQITIATSGTIDLIRLRLESTDQARPWYWSVSLQGQNIKLPTFPQEFLNLLEQKAMPTMNLTELSLFDGYEDKDSQSLIAGHLDRSYYLGGTNSRIKSYSLRPEVNGGRKQNREIKIPDSTIYLNREWLDY